MQSSNPLPFVVRQSTLEAARCLYRVQQEQIIGIATVESEFAVRGTDFHLMAKMYVDYLVASKQEMDWSYADELISSRSWNEDAILLCKGWSRRTSIDPSVVFATEYRVRLDSDMHPCSSDDAMYSGDFDRVEISGRTAVIHDYKTNFMAHDPTTIQSSFYPWLLFKIFSHLDTITFRLEFVRYGIVRSREFTRDDMERIDRYVSGQVARLRTAVDTAEWPAAVNSKCTFCSLNCPLVEAGMSRESIGQIRSAEQAQAMVQELYAMEMQAKRTRLILKGYASQRGTIDAGNDIKMGFSKRSTFKYDVRSIVKLNEEHGFDKLRTLAVVPGDVKKIGRDYPEYVQRAQKTAKDKSTTVFQFWNEVGDPMEIEEEE